MLYSEIETPIGTLFCVKDTRGLRKVQFADQMDQSAIPASWKRADEAFADERKQFAEYFAGERNYFDLKIAPQGTPFQKSVLHALQKIPYGQTRSYRQIAQEVGNPKAVRAVGMANNRNPLPIVIPCHRVVGIKGDLTGYAGGLDIKKKLLELEKYAAVSHN